MVGTPATSVVPNSCAAAIEPTDRTRVVRLFNNFKGGALNHRYTTSASEALSLADDGWIVEGAVFCAKP